MADNATSRIPEQEREARLLLLRETAQERGLASGSGIRPAGAPFPQATLEHGYYGPCSNRRSGNGKFRSISLWVERQARPP